jgi:hypothetical protein
MYGCIDCEKDCDKYCVHGFPQTENPYYTNFTELTEKGVRVDREGVVGAPTLNQIDQAIDEVEACLTRNFPGGYMGEEIRLRTTGAYDSFTLPLKRKCLRVKVAADTVEVDGCELLPWPAPTALCEAKGLTPTEDRPCRWRAGIQDRQTAVTTPNLYLLKDPIVRIVTGSSAIWSEPLLAECAGR